jgi:enoyl-CoA hydratase/carnithine racemase
MNYVLKLMINLKKGLKLPLFVLETMKATIGHRKAELALETAHGFTAEEALLVHLIDEIVDTPQDLMATATERMKMWCKLPR